MSAAYDCDMQITYPDKFLEVRAQFLDPTATSLCAGYEGGHWRAAQLADHLFQWLPYAALNAEHQLSFASHNFVEMLKRAAAHIYNTKKTQSRGEIGELLLHIACVSQFGAIPVVCKLILKSSSNDTVKGFDGVHLVVNGSDFELWLGESKFYEDGQHAIRDAVTSVEKHILPKFLSTEKAMLFGHIPSDIPHHAEIKGLFQQQTSSDKLLKAAVFPILITYESAAVKQHKSLSEEYSNALKAEVDALRQSFSQKAKNLQLKFHLIFLPLEAKILLVNSFDTKLKAFL